LKMSAVTSQFRSSRSFCRSSFYKYTLSFSNWIHTNSEKLTQELNEVPKDFEVVAKDVKSELIDLDTLASYTMKRTDAKINPGTIYTNKSNLYPTFKGKKEKPRLIWDEFDCSTTFPSSPEEAKLDLLQYLEQRDIWERRQNVAVPTFCVGSIIAVTRGDQYAPEGFTRFVGLCIYKNLFQNTKKAHFILRNVIQNEPLEILYPIYSPLIHKIEVLKHERWEKEDKDNGLLFLRDFPPKYSTVDENIKAVEYTEEPTMREWTDDDRVNIKNWFDAIFEKRKRR